MTTIDTFGSALGCWLRQLGLSKQVDALAWLDARGCAVSAQALSAYLAGERVPSRQRAEALLDALEVHGPPRLHAYTLLAGL